MNKWFDEVFLPSLFEYAGINHRAIISHGQYEICTRNMRKVSNTKYDTFNYEWHGRNVHVVWFYNNSGTIEFGFTEFEQSEIARKGQNERDNRDTEHIEFCKSNHARLERHIKHCKAEIEALKEEIAYIIEDIEEMEDNGDINGANKEKEYLSKCNAELDEKEAFLRNLQHNI